MSLQFVWPLVGLLLPLPLLAWWWLPRAQTSPETALKVPFFEALASTRTEMRRKPWWLITLAVLGWAALVVAAARPQLIGEQLILPVNGRDLLMAVDISGSMDTEDMILQGRKVTRLVAVKQVAGEFIARREGDRLGLILFGKRAYLQTPLTFDRETTRTLLDESEIGLAGKETAIGDAIGLAVKRLRNQPQENRVLIILTDGANTAGEVEPLKAAELAAIEGVRVYTIGVGADELMVRSFFGTRRINPSADLDEDTLTKIADKTGGQYFRARDTNNLVKIYELLDEIEPVSMEQETFRPVKDLYYWPLSGAFLVTLLLSVAWIGRVAL